MSFAMKNGVTTRPDHLHNRAGHTVQKKTARSWSSSLRYIPAEGQPGPVPTGCAGGRTAAGRRPWRCAAAHPASPASAKGGNGGPTGVNSSPAKPATETLLCCRAFHTGLALSGGVAGRKQVGGGPPPTHKASDVQNPHWGVGEIMGNKLTWGTRRCENSQGARRVLYSHGTSASEW